MVCCSPSIVVCVRSLFFSPPRRSGLGDKSKEGKKVLIQSIENVFLFFLWAFLIYGLYVKCKCLLLKWSLEWTLPKQTPFKTYKFHALLFFTVFLCVCANFVYSELTATQTKLSTLRIYVSKLSDLTISSCFVYLSCLWFKMFPFSVYTIY